MSPPLFSLRNRDHHNASKSHASPNPTINPGSNASSLSKGNSKVQPIINEGLEYLEQTSKLLDSNKDVLDPKRGYFNERAALLANSAPVANKLTKGRLRPKEFHDSAQQLFTELRDVVTEGSGEVARRRAKASSFSGRTIIPSYPDTLISPTVSQVYPNGQERGPFWVPKSQPVPLGRSISDARPGRDVIHTTTNPDGSKRPRTRQKRSDTVPAPVSRRRSRSSFVQGSSSYPYGGLAEAHEHSRQYPNYRRREEDDLTRSAYPGDSEHRPSSRSHRQPDEYYRSRHQRGDYSDESGTSALSEKTRWPGRERERPVDLQAKHHGHRRHHSEDVYFRDRPREGDGEKIKDDARDRKHRDKDRGGDRARDEHEHYYRYREDPGYHSSKHEHALRRRPSFGRYDDYGPRYYYDRDRDKDRSRKYDHYSHDRRRHGKHDYYDYGHDRDRGYYSSHRHRHRDGGELYRDDGRDHRGSRRATSQPTKTPTPPAKTVTPANVPLPPSITPSPSPTPAPLSPSKSHPPSTASIPRAITPTTSLPPSHSPAQDGYSHQDTRSHSRAGSREHTQSRGKKRESLPIDISVHPPSMASTISWRPSSPLAPRGGVKARSFKRKKQPYSMAISESTNTPTIVPYPAGDGASDVYEMEMGRKNNGGGSSGKKGGVLGKMFGFGGKNGKSKFVEVFSN